MPDFDDLVVQVKQIDLHEFFESLGYQRDKSAAKSSTSPIQIFRLGDQCLSVKRDTGRYKNIQISDAYTYYVNKGDDGAHAWGDIIQWYRRRNPSLSFKEAVLQIAREKGIGNKTHRKEPLQKSDPKPGALKDTHSIAPAKRDNEKIMADMQEWPLASQHHYLEQVRRISRSTITAARFSGRVYRGQHGNAVFPHFDRDDLGWYQCGYEMKNKGYKMENKDWTGFSSGGHKGLWLSNYRHEDEALVICEGAIDCLSYYELHNAMDSSFFVSFGGRMNKRQRDLLSHVIAKNTTKKIILAVDNDDAGDKYEVEIKDLVKNMHVSFVRHSPKNRQSDWNDVLKSLRASLDG